MGSAPPRLMVAFRLGPTGQAYALTSPSELPLSVRRLTNLIGLGLRPLPTVNQRTKAFGSAGARVSECALARLPGCPITFQRLSDFENGIQFANTRLCLSVCLPVRV